MYLKPAAAATAAAVATVALSGPALAAGKAILYSPNPVQAYEAVQKVVKETAGIDVSVIAGGSAVLMRRIEAEASAPQGDFFWSSSANTMGAFEHLFEAYPAPALEAIAPELRYPGDLFIPTNVHVVTMLVNSEQLDGLPMPERWSDLADPAWNGKVIVADPVNSSTGYTILWGLSKLLDDATYRAVVANLVVSGSASAVHQGAAMGEYAVGLTFETNSYAYVDGGQQEMKIVYPADGTFITPEFVGLIKGAPNGEDAKAAVDALLSKDSQVALLQVAFRRPSRTDVKVSDYVTLPEMSEITVFPTDESEAAAQRDAFLKTWAELPKSGD